MRERMIAERLLPHLPVYEILSTLQLYQDGPGEFRKRIESTFPAGNSVFVVLHEDSHPIGIGGLGGAQGEVDARAVGLLPHSLR